MNYDKVDWEARLERASELRRKLMWESMQGHCQDCYSLIPTVEKAFTIIPANGSDRLVCKPCRDTDMEKVVAKHLLTRFAKRNAA